MGRRINPSPQAFMEFTLCLSGRSTYKKYLRANPHSSTSSQITSKKQPLLQEGQLNNGIINFLPDFDRNI